MAEPFKLGVNYWPRRKAMYWWSDFDAGEVREEFALIRELGMSLVRIFLLWDDFQPEPESVSADSLANLRTVCDIAAENGLALDVTFFTGHMSGPNWSPRWLLEGKPLPDARQLVSAGHIVDSGYRNPYTDPAALRAERLLLSTVAKELGDHPAVGFWNLGNEPDLFAWPPSSDSGAAWIREMAGVLRAADPAHAVTCGLHADSLNRDNGFRIDKAFRETDFAVMHSYPMYTNLSRSPLDPDFVPFTCAVTAAISGKPVLMEEFGGCTTGPGKPSETWEWTSVGQSRTQFMASEEDLAEYFRLVLPRLVDVGATGAVAWCFADYASELWDRPPCLDFWHERFFGLVRPDGSLKPHAQVFKDFAATNPTVNPNPPRTVRIPVTIEDYYKNTEKYLREMYERF